MGGQSRDVLPREIDSLILQALVRKLLAKGVLSQEDVHALLTDAVASLTNQPGPDAPTRPQAG